MIASHRHRFVFVKTRKPAGTSLEIALSRHCGPEDVITPISAADERLRRELGGTGPQNHLTDPQAYNHMRARRVIGSATAGAGVVVVVVMVNSSWSGSGRTTVRRGRSPTAGSGIPC